MSEGIFWIYVYHHSEALLKFTNDRLVSFWLSLHLALHHKLSLATRLMWRSLWISPTPCLYPTGMMHPFVSLLSKDLSMNSDRTYHVLRNTCQLSHVTCRVSLSVKKKYIYTRRYGPLRWPTSNSCGGLQPLAEAFLPFGQQKAYYAVLTNFWQFLVSSSNLGNF